MKSYVGLTAGLISYLVSNIGTAGGALSDVKEITLTFDENQVPDISDFEANPDAFAKIMDQPSTLTAEAINQECAKLAPLFPNVVRCLSVKVKAPDDKSKKSNTKISSKAKKTTTVHDIKVSKLNNVISTSDDENETNGKTIVHIVRDKDSKAVYTMKDQQLLSANFWYGDGSTSISIYPSTVDPTRYIGVETDFSKGIGPIMPPITPVNVDAVEDNSKDVSEMHRRMQQGKLPENIEIVHVYTDRVAELLADYGGIKADAAKSTADVDQIFKNSGLPFGVISKRTIQVVNPTTNGVFDLLDWLRAKLPALISNAGYAYYQLHLSGDQLYGGFCGNGDLAGREIVKQKSDVPLISFYRVNCGHQAAAAVLGSNLGLISNVEAQIPGVKYTSYLLRTDNHAKLLDGYFDYSRGKGGIGTIGAQAGKFEDLYSARGIFVNVDGKNVEAGDANANSVETIKDLVRLKQSFEDDRYIPNPPTYSPSKQPTPPTTAQPYGGKVKKKKTKNPVAKTNKPVTTVRPKSSPNPTFKPSKMPTGHSTSAPSEQPTGIFTTLPSEQPTFITRSPSVRFTLKPTTTAKPTSTAKPTNIPTEIPTAMPTKMPTNMDTDTPSAAPSQKPVVKTHLPSAQPTVKFTTQAPTDKKIPTKKPTAKIKTGNPTPQKVRTKRPTAKTGKPTTWFQKSTANPTKKSKIQPTPKKKTTKPTKLGKITNKPTVPTTVNNAAPTSDIKRSVPITSAATSMYDNFFIESIAKHVAKKLGDYFQPIDSEDAGKKKDNPRPKGKKN